MTEGRPARYPHVASAIKERPWAILEGTYRTIVEVMDFYAAGGSFSREEVEARIAAGPGSRSTQSAGGVAVIPISGVIMPRASLFGDVSGGTSVEALRNDFRAALDDDDVRAVVFDIDSPGGSVDLVPELAADLRAARGEKPVVAQANTLMASAAYWLGSQADSVFATPSATVGSIGVFGTHTDRSEAQAKAGVKTTLVSAGDFKTEGNPYEPLSEEGRDHMQTLVDAAYDLFVGDVAAARGATEEAVRTGYGRGRSLDAKAAHAAGLVDGVQTFERTVANLMRTGSPSGEPALAGEWQAVRIEVEPTGSTLVDEADAARAAVADVVTRMRALREVREGRLTSVKRDALEALNGELVQLGGAILDALESLPAEPREVAKVDALVAIDTVLAEAEARLRL